MARRAQSPVHAAEHIRLLLTEDLREARRLAEELDRANAERQELQGRIAEEAVAQAEELFERLPVADLGCLYLDGCGNPVTPVPGQLDGLRRHFGSQGGSWPATYRRKAAMAPRS